MQKRKQTQAFTVIELIVVIAVIAILTIAATSLYRPFVLKGHRNDGVSAILALQLLEENYRSNNTTYGSIANIGGSSTSAQGYYTLAISGTSATAFTITATAVGNQANDKEGATACSTLTLAVSNGSVTQTPAACWPQ